MVFFANLEKCNIASYSLKIFGRVLDVSQELSGWFEHLFYYLGGSRLQGACFTIQWGVCFAYYSHRNLKLPHNEKKKKKKKKKKKGKHTHIYTLLHTYIRLDINM